MALIYKDFEYRSTNSEITITRYLGSDISVNVPSTVNGLPVTAIGDYAFWNCTATVINIADSVVSIGNNAFQNCTVLTTVKIPDSVKSIGECAFSSCTALRSITIPDSVTSIGNMAFRFCTSLENVTVNNSVTSIGDRAFIGCSALKINTKTVAPVNEDSKDIFEYKKIDSEIEITKYTGSDSEVVIPATINGLPVRSIGKNAFRFHDEIKSVKIPKSVNLVGEYAFSYCESLTDIIIPAKYIREYAFSHCTALTSVTILYSISFQEYAFTIGEGAFAHCTALTRFTVPNLGNEHARINENAFVGCNALKNSALTNPAESDGKIIFYKGNLRKRYYSSSDDTNFKHESTNSGIKITGFKVGTVGKILNIPSQIDNLPVVSIGRYAFFCCKSLERVFIPDSVTYISDSAFDGCESLKKAFIPERASMGIKAFNDCPLLSAPSRYTFPSHFFPDFQKLTVSEISQLVEQMNKFFETVRRLKRSLNGNEELLYFVNQIESILESEGYSYALDKSATEIFNKLEAEYRQQKEFGSMPRNFRIYRLKTTPHISTELIDAINQIENLGKSNYSLTLNDSVEKVVDVIKTAINMEQALNKNPVANLLALVNAVSDKQIAHSAAYIKKFHDQIAEVKSSINPGIKALEDKKITLQNRRKEQNAENKNRIRADIKTLLS